MVDQYIWQGRNRVARATVTLCKSDGGLGQIDIGAQYKALTGSIIIWVTMSGHHPLRSILRGHIGAMSLRRWGNADLSWVVTKSGRLQTDGSGPWSNICQGWHDLKAHITTRRPANIDEWRDLPLWRPHVNDLIPGRARCYTRSQCILRDSGILSMGDVMCVDGTIRTWANMAERGIPARCEGAYTDLVSNLVQVPTLDNSCSLKEFYVESVNLRGPKQVWQFMLPPAHCTERWIPFMDRTSPSKAYVCQGLVLRPTELRAPSATMVLRRIVVYSGGSRFGLNGGPWPDNQLLTQYQWQGGTPLTNSSSRSPLLNLKFMY